MGTLIGGFEYTRKVSGTRDVHGCGSLMLLGDRCERDHQYRLQDRPDWVQGWGSVCVDGGFQNLTKKAIN